MELLRRALPLAFALTLVLPLGHRVALASCVQETAADQAARADVIVAGTVTETRQTFAAASGVIRFLPERVLKGTLAHEVQVYLGPTRGGAVTSVDYTAVGRGELHTLYLRAVDDGSYETNACSGSHAGAPTANEEKLLGAGTVVAATSDDRLSPAAAVAIGALVALVAVAVSLAVRRRRRAT
jgi:preprotein translocase subunit Sec61beta